MRGTHTASSLLTDTSTLQATLLHGDELLALYLGGYVFLILAVAGIINTVVWGKPGTAGFFGLSLELQQARLRWLLVCLLLSLAGLPPFFFFGCKLGILSLLLHSGAWALAGTVAALIFLSWAVYFSAVRRLFFVTNADSGLPLWQHRSGGCLAVGFSILLLVVGAGLFFIDDAYLVLAWALSL
jgi:NADH:ubiquinone oxidoreductase subunit 2 (subunit N)